MTTKKTEATTTQPEILETQFARQMEGLIDLVLEHPEQFSKARFTPEETAQMQSALRRYKTSHLSVLAARGRRSQQTAEVKPVIDGSVAYRADLAETLRLLGKDGGIAAPPLRKRDALGVSPIRWVRWLTEVRGTIEAQQGALAASMERPLPRLDELLSKLTHAVSSQQAASKELKSLETAQRSSRAELERLAGQLRHAARVAFRGQREVLLRLTEQPGRRHRKPVAPAAAA